MYHALDWMESIVKDNTTEERLRFLVCSDSRSLCDALKNVTWKNRDFWILKIQEQLTKLEADVTILWIPSHCDVPGNEKADELANQGALADQSGIHVTEAIIKAKIKNEKWTISHPRAINTYGDRRSPKMEIERTWSRNVRSLYARLRTGHAKELKDYRHRILEKEDDPNCETCGIAETIEHVLCNCAVTEEARVRNWNGNVELRMMVSEPEVCRKILAARFPILKAKQA